MVGPFNSSVAKAQIPITNDAGPRADQSGDTSPGLTKGDDAKKLRTSHPDVNTYFRVCTTDDRQGAAGAQFARKLGFKKAFVVDDNETYGKGLADVFEEQFKTAGGTVLGHEHLTKGQKDYKALLTKAHAPRPTWCSTAARPRRAAACCASRWPTRASKDIAFVGGDGISDEEFLKSAGDMANGAYYTVAAPETAKLASARAFVTAYKKRWNTNVGPYSANAYAATRTSSPRSRKPHGRNGDRCRRARTCSRTSPRRRTSTSPIGPIGFDENGDTTIPILSLYEITGGKPVFVQPDQT